MSRWAIWRWSTKRRVVAKVEWHPGELYPRVGFIREKLVKIGAKFVSHARCAVFQMADVAMPRQLFRRILELIDELRPRQPAPC